MLHSLLSALDEHQAPPMSLCREVADPGAGSVPGQDSLSPLPGTERRSSTSFRTGEIAKTEVRFQRGAVLDPIGAGVIPEGSFGSPVFVLTDETVNGLYGDAFVAALRAGGLDVHRLVMPDGEEAKTLASYVHLCERVLARGIDEGSALISLGGGAVCNVCGFIASTLYRGIRLVHVPTTLMAQCDAAISHKQAVNSARGKNLVGNYYAPQAIVVDVDALGSLATWRLSDGIAEALKHALAEDPVYLSWLDRSAGSLGDPGFLETVVRRNVTLKAALMARDPKEHNEAMVLQYGHSFGHPIELVSGFRVAHGQAVAIGMMIAARVSVRMGAASRSLIAQHEAILSRFDLPTQVPAELPVTDILDALRANKRYLAGATRMALLEDVGRLWRVDGEAAIEVPEQVLRDCLEETRERPEITQGGPA